MGALTRALEGIPVPSTPLLAVSLGAPAGIGPEVVAKAWDSRQMLSVPPFVAVGDPRSFKRPVRVTIQRALPTDDVLVLRDKKGEQVAAKKSPALPAAHPWKGAANLDVLEALPRTDTVTPSGADVGKKRSQGPPEATRPRRNGMRARSPARAFSIRFPAPCRR